MKNNFDIEVKRLYEKSYKIVDNYLKTDYKDGNSEVTIPKDFQDEFFSLVDKVNLNLMEDKDNFYGYFLFQMEKEIKYDISSPTAVNFKGNKYVIYFNPVIFLTLNIRQMESTIKHEILHVVSMHLIRAKEFKGRYSKLAVNMAMDIVVTKYLDYLPPFSTTLERVNLFYSLKLLPFESFEYYAEKIQTAIDLLEEDDDSAEDETKKNEKVETDFKPEKTHDLWEDSSDLDEETLREFTEKFVNNSQKGTIPDYLENILASLKNSKAELPWNLYLKKLMGAIESNKKKTITRRNRRQPDRLDLRGELRNHKANIVVALDISGSISDEEFNQAIKEVLNITKNYNHEITILECDNEIRREYKIKTSKDIKSRINKRGATRFTPVFQYANKNKVNLLVYFTDGKGEDELLEKPKGYKTLWVISGGGNGLSLKEPYGIVKKLSQIEVIDNSVDVIDVIMRDGYSMQNQEALHS